MYNPNPDPFDQWGDGSQAESHELNERAPINYNQNTYMSGDVRETSVESLNIDNMQVKGNQLNGEVRQARYNEVAKEGGYQLFWKYSEQIKSVSAGILLLFCGGMHTVWSIYQVLFYQTSEIYRRDLEHINETEWRDHFFAIVTFSERNGLMFTIIAWYVGVMIGCYAAGWFLVRVVQKRNIYYICSLIMFISGCLFYSADVADSGWQTLLLFARLIAGISHGITYVTVFVQASENASKDFRRVIVTTIGIIIGLSIFIASTFLIYIPIPTVQKMEGLSNVALTSETMSSGIISTITLILCFVSVVFNYFFSHETVPFLLYHNYREDEAQFTVAKLLGEDRNSAVVHEEFTTIRELCNDDYAEYPEGKIFTSIHRSLMSIVLSSRISSAQCLNMLCIVFFVKYIQSLIERDVNELENTKATNDTMLVEELTELLELAETYSIAVRSAIATWFVAGVQFTLIGNYFNWKRGLHFTTFVVGATILLSTIFHIISFLGGLFRAFAILFLSIYVHFLSLPVDILGYSYLTECFPISTNAKSIGFVTICESLFNAIVITLEIRHDRLNIEFFMMGLIFCLLGFRLYSIVPNTLGLSLGAAKHAYIHALSTKKWWQF